MEKRPLKPQKEGAGRDRSAPAEGRSEVRGKLGITETVLRDGHQSIMATRLALADMLPVAEQMDEVGYPLHRDVGRGDFRCRHAFPEGRPLGSPEDAPKDIQKDAASDASPRAESSGIPPLFR